MTEETTQEITYDGVKYPIDSISDKGKYIISQLQEIRQKTEELRRQLDRLEVAHDAFSTHLGEELKEEAEGTKTAEDEFVSE